VGQKGGWSGFDEQVVDQAGLAYSDCKEKHDRTFDPSRCPKRFGIGDDCVIQPSKGFFPDPTGHFVSNRGRASFPIPD